MRISIRNAVTADASIIVDFNARMATETEGHSLDSGLIDAGADALLADTSKGRYWIAEQAGKSSARSS